MGAGTLVMSAGCSSDDGGTPPTETRPETGVVTEVTTDPRQQSVITTDAVGPTTVPQRAGTPSNRSSGTDATVRNATRRTSGPCSRSTAETSSPTGTRSGSAACPAGTGIRASSTTSVSTSTAGSTTTSEATSTPTTTSTADVASSPSDPLLTGAYIGGSGSYTDDLELFESWLGHPPALTMEFVEGLRSEDVVSRFVPNRMTPIWEAGSVPVITWLPSTGSTTDTADDIAREVADGDHDALLETWAARLNDWTTDDGTQRRFYFRPGHEMNGNWFPWSADSSSTTNDYVEMWRQIHAVFTESGLDETTIQWMWSPNADEIGGVRAEAYYPGDDYVDWVGLDGFNFGDSQSYSEWRTPEEIFGPMLERMRELTGKPVALPEVASSSFKGDDFTPSAKARWVRRLFSFADDRDVRMVNWFNTEKSGQDESDWAVFGGERGTDTHEIDGDSYATYDAYRATVNSPSVIHGTAETSSRLTDREFSGDL
jgi:mannan endo-1,4-beta-mannosidase